MVQILKAKEELFKNMKKLIYFLLFISLYYFCAPQAAQPATPAETESEIVIIGEEEEKKPAPEEKKGEETVVITEEETPAPSPAPETVEEGEVVIAPTSKKETPPPQPSPSKVFGYRVQILAVDASKPGNKEKAEKFAKEAEARLKGEYKVYVEYIPPYYKVRVGDFISREEAERMKMRLRSLGYYDAWIAETEVAPKR